MNSNVRAASQRAAESATARSGGSHRRSRTTLRAGRLPRRLHRTSPAIHVLEGSVDEKVKVQLTRLSRKRGVTIPKNYREPPGGDPLPSVAGPSKMGRSETVTGGQKDGHGQDAPRLHRTSQGNPGAQELPDGGLDSGAQSSSRPQPEDLDAVRGIGDSQDTTRSRENEYLTSEEIKAPGRHRVANGPSPKEMQRLAASPRQERRDPAQANCRRRIDA